MILKLYTNSYPFGKGEEFIANEIQILSRYFDKIIIYPKDRSGKKRKVPDNVAISNSTKNEYKRLGIFWGNIFIIIKIINADIKTGYKIRNILNPLYISTLLRVFHLSNQIPTSTTNVVNYSYWFNEWALALSIAKEKGRIKMFISRGHGYDIDYCRYKTGIPYQSYKLKMTNELYLVSNKSREIVVSKYPNYESRLLVSYLGTIDSGVKKMDETDVYFEIVSCSYVRTVKRLELIIEALKYINFKISWTHIGGGDNLVKYQKMCEDLPENVTCNFTGHLSNGQIMCFYQERSFNLFINTSSFEGLPVSLMEAASFGIPLMATNVGGNSEIVTNETGILLDANPEAKVIAEAITDFRNSSMNSNLFRERVRQYWENHFDAEKNYTNFFKEITRNCN